MTAIQNNPAQGSFPEEPVPVRQGSAPNQVDGHQRAARIQERNVGWLVLFGAYTQEFVAFPRPMLPVSGWLASQDPGKLARLMQQAEAGAMPRGLQAAKSTAGPPAAGAEGAA